MFSALTTGYLFLGGAGAGALVVLSLLECANAQRRFGRSPIRALATPALAFTPANATRARLRAAFALPDEFFARAWPLCFVALAVGMLCLLVDLGRPDRLLNLVISPEFSAVAVGAYALALSLVVAATFSLLALLDLPRMRCVAVYASAVVGIVAGLATMGYTGVLLQSMASVLFWQTPLLTTLFMLSSASCGIAIAFLGASFVEARHPFVSPIAWLARIDSALIVLEALCLAAYLVGAASNQGTLLAAEALVAGEEAWLFWGGLVVCGLAVPLALERFVTHGNYRTQLLWIAALLLAGGFVLRWCIAGAADYDVTQMPNALFGYTMMN